MKWNLSFKLNKKDSDSRKHLKIAVYEGIPAVILGNVLGGPFLTGYMLYLGASSAQVGFALAIPAFANLIQLLVAYYMQKINNRKLYWIGFGAFHRIVWVLTGLIPLFLPQQYWVATFIWMFLLSFIGASAGGVIWSSLIADMVPAQLRGRYFGIRNTIHGAIAAIVVLIGGQILEILPNAEGFAILYWIAAGATLWNIYLAMLYPNPPFEKSPASDRNKLLLKPFKDRSFLYASLFLAGWILLQNIVVPLFSYVMLDIMKVSIRTVSIITTVQMIVMMVSYYIWGNMNARFDTRKLLYWTLPIIAAACALWGAVSFLPVLLVLIMVHVLLGFGLGGFNQLAFNFVIEDASQADRPMYVAVFSALTGLTGFLGPIIGGIIYKELKELPDWIERFGLTTFLGFILLALAFILGPKILKDRKL